MSRTDIQLLTCNVQRANVTRTLRQVAWLASSNADALVLTEVSAGESGDLLARSLTEIGFGVLIPKPAANDRYRILVACRDVEPTSVEIGAGSIGHRCAAARIAFPAGEIGVLGLYVPSRGPKDRRNQDKRAFQDCAAMLLPRVTAALDVSVLL
jgi:exodeoxyribonuclease-3